MRTRCKVWPTTPSSAFPKDTLHWLPILNVKLIYKHSPPTKWFECIVDSGSPCCMFHASLCQPLGIKLEDGVEEEIGGIVSASRAAIYYHKITMIIGSERITTTAGFSEALSVLGLLGRTGFFENFVVKFDSSESPPILEADRIYRS